MPGLLRDCPSPSITESDQLRIPGKTRLCIRVTSDISIYVENSCGTIFAVIWVNNAGA